MMNSIMKGKVTGGGNNGPSDGAHPPPRAPLQGRVRLGWAGHNTSPGPLEVIVTLDENMINYGDNMRVTTSGLPPPTSCRVPDSPIYIAMRRGVTVAAGEAREAPRRGAATVESGVADSLRSKLRKEEGCGRPPPFPPGSPSPVLVLFGRQSLHK